MSPPAKYLIRFCHDLKVAAKTLTPNMVED